MRFSFCFALLATTLAAHGQLPTLPATPRDLQRATLQLRAKWLGIDLTKPLAEQKPADIKPALALANELKSDGSWPDIDYANPSRSAWPAYKHPARILTLAIAMHQPGIAPEERLQLKDATLKALKWWRVHDPQCPNWWYNIIGVPQQLSAAALLMGTDLDPDDVQYLLKNIMMRGKQIMTGQNRVWLSGNNLNFSLFMQNTPMARDAANAIWDEVKMTTNEGIQPDASFHQHGAQQQFGNYGLAFASDIQHWWEMLRGTNLGIPPKKVKAMRRYMLDGQAWITWRGMMDISSMGRQLMPHAQSSKANSAIRTLERMAEVDDELASQYLAAAARLQPGATNDLVGLRWYWRSDYGVFRRPAFCATVKACSPRVIGTETCNSENLSGLHLADGATYFYRDGREYEDIFPVWDWHRLPGTTCTRTSNLTPSGKQAHLPGEFTGGVTDGTRGCAALDFQRDGVSARKAWFFDGDLVICLGTGITGKNCAAPVLTSINQCLKRGDVRAQTEGQTTTLINAVRSLPKVAWLEHDGLRYDFPDLPTLSAGSQKQTGNWSSVFKNAVTPPDDVTLDVFSAWLDHTAKPVNARYAYAVHPITAAVPAYQILANTTEKQAVCWDRKRIAAIFWTAGQLNTPDGHVLRVDIPCLLVWDGKQVFVSDPTGKEWDAHVTIDGKKLTIHLPHGGDCGKSVTTE
jgi:chondroitin AC lyase